VGRSRLQVKPNFAPGSFFAARKFLRSTHIFVEMRQRSALKHLLTLPSLCPLREKIFFQLLLLLAAGRVF
jgi:hypothetical protein